MAPVFNYENSTTTSATFTSSTIPTESIPTFTAEVIHTVPALKAIPTWAYVLIALFFLFIMVFVFIIFKYWRTIRTTVETSWRRRKELSMWKGVEEGRREKLVDALQKLEGRQKRENDEIREKEFWGDVEYIPDPTSSLILQSQDWGRMYRAGILAKLKTLDDQPPVSRFGGIRPPELVVPERALVRESWPVIEFPGGMVQWPYFRA